jgi:hypothetical protein
MGRKSSPWWFRYRQVSLYYSGFVISCVGVQPLACYDWGFEPRQDQGCRADYSPRGHLPSVMCLRRIVKPRKWTEYEQLDALTQKKKKSRFLAGRDEQNQTINQNGEPAKIPIASPNYNFIRLTLATHRIVRPAIRVHDPFIQQTTAKIRSEMYASDSIAASTFLLKRSQPLDCTPA